MRKSKLILIGVATALAVVLFLLPKSVVENEQLQEVTQTENHSMEMPAEVAREIELLKGQIEEAENLNKKTNFAHALARRFLDYGELDSAARYAEEIQVWTSSDSELAADIYFTAYERAGNPEQAQDFAQKARAILQALLDKDPANLAIKNRLAMTLVVSDNPMAGISMLREILAADETNRQAILNLGLLAIQSGQFERAKERFENLVSLDEEDYEAKLYLSVTLMEINEPAQARLLLEEILATQDSIPAIKMMANDYLQAL